MIQAEKIDSGFAVKCPFDLKDQFRKNFPSAKWNSTHRRWEVGPRSGKRLEQWVAEVNGSGVIEEIEHRDEVELQEQELRDLRTQLASLKSNIHRQAELATSAVDIKTVLSQARSDLESAKTELRTVSERAKAAEKAAQSERETVTALLNQTLNLDAVLDAQKTMARYADQVGARARQEYDRAQAVIAAEHNKLKKAGFRSAGLGALASANFNRPDRDHPKFVRLDDIMKVTKISDA